MGVNNESMSIGDGCYADFTLPSARARHRPGRSTAYWAVGDRAGEIAQRRVDLGRILVRNGVALGQGPLLLDWSRRRFGVGNENSCLQKINRQHGETGTLVAGKRQNSDPSRLVFVKPHTHGPNGASRMYCSASRWSVPRRLRGSGPDSLFRFHYVRRGDGQHRPRRRANLDV